MVLSELAGTLRVALSTTEWCGQPQCDRAPCKYGPQAVGPSGLATGGECCGGLFGVVADSVAGCAVQSSVRSLILVSETGHLVSIGNDNRVLVWDYSKGEVVQAPLPPAAHCFGVVVCSAVT